MPKVRPVQQLASATVVLSIDVDPTLPGEVAHEGAASNSQVQALFDQIVESELSATWAFDQPGVHPLVPRIAASADQELALSAGVRWAGAEASRSVFSAGLMARMVQARDAGCRSTSLALYDGELSKELDLLVRHGITAVRTALRSAPSVGSRSGWSLLRLFGVRSSGKSSPAAAQAAAEGAPIALRWGLRQFAPTLVFPGPGARQAERQVDRLLRSGGLLVAAVDIPRLCEASVSTRSAVVRWIETIANRQASEGLTVATLAEVVTQLDVVSQGRPTESILKRAG